MRRAELIGGVLFSHPHPEEGAKALSELLVAPDADRNEARRRGFEPDLVDAIRRVLSRDTQNIERACFEGAAWVLGRRSVGETSPTWELVATLEPGASLPAGLTRTTGETLIHLATSSTQQLRIAAPFIDEIAIGFLVDSLAAATARAVVVEIGIPNRSTRAGGGLAHLTAAVEDRGDPKHLLLREVRRDGAWAHLKVVSSDRRAAYIGSANITGPGLEGRNLELGVLVTGDRVATIDAILDSVLR